MDFLYIPPGHRDRNCYRRKRYHDPQLDYYLNLIRITYSAADEVAQGKKKSIHWIDSTIRTWEPNL